MGHVWERDGAGMDSEQWGAWHPRWAAAGRVLLFNPASPCPLGIGMALLTPPGIPKSLALGVLKFRDVPAERNATRSTDWGQTIIKRTRGLCDAHEDSPENGWDAATMSRFPPISFRSKARQLRQKSTGIKIKTRTWVSPASAPLGPQTRSTDCCQSPHDRGVRCRGASPRRRSES